MEWSKHRISGRYYKTQERCVLFLSSFLFTIYREAAISILNIKRMKVQERDHVCRQNATSYGITTASTKIIKTHIESYYVSMSLYNDQTHTSFGVNGSKKQSNNRIKLKVRLLSIVGIYSFTLLRTKEIES